MPFAQLTRAAVLTLSLAVAGCAAQLRAEPEMLEQRQAVEQFYERVLAFDVHGLPSQADLVQLTPLMSEELKVLFEQARAQQVLDHARHQGSEPPLVQGAIFFSLFEGASRVVAISPEPAPQMWAVKLAYGSGADAFEWTDWVRVTQEAGRWVVADVEYMGQWDFARSGWLSNALLAVQSQP